MCIGDMISKAKIRNKDQHFTILLYLQNSDMTSALDSLGANWSRICLSRALNHGALWHIVFLRLRNILIFLLTYLLKDK